MSSSVQRIPTQQLRRRRQVAPPGKAVGRATVTDIRHVKKPLSAATTLARVPVERPDRDPFHKNSPSRALLDTLSDKWTVLILLSMEEQALRHGVIKTRVEGITPKMLNQRLGVLVDGGLVLRTAYPVTPPRVEYGLTELGRSVIQPVKALYSWAVDNVDEVEAHRYG